MRLVGPVLCVVLVAGSACVSKSKHEAQTARLQASEAKRADQDKTISRLRSDNKQLEDELDSARASSKQQRSDLQGKLSATKQQLAELARQRRAAEARAKAFKRLTDEFRRLIATGKIRVYVRRGRMIVALPSGVLFGSGKVELSKAGQRTLRRVAKRLAKFPKRRFIVAGHTDNVRIGKKVAFQDNWELSAVRALNVTRFMIGAGVSPKNLAAAGYAEFDPIRRNRTRAGRRLNRRIEIILVPNIPELRTKLRRTR
jgi:chemotaxis protein MotB